jgi:adenine C2-methylase RlmN of 23S rRNA A2503 and tRNA A37
MDEKLFVSLRQSRGQGIMAACGQLGTSLSDGLM